MSTEDTIVSGMAGRYANALFELAGEHGEHDRVGEDLSRFIVALGDSADLQRLVRSPVFSAADQARAIGAILAKLGVSPLTANFFKLIAHNRRLFAVENMIAGYRALLARSRGEITAEVQSAAPLSDAQMQTLRETLKASTGKDVQIKTTVDPTLLGGLVVKIGSRMIDSSLRTKLNSLKIAMKEVG